MISSMRFSLPLILSAMVVPALAGAQTAEQVIAKCQKAYDSVKTLKQEAAGSGSGASATATIWFSRPGNLRVTGRTLFRTPYDLISTPKETWLLTNGEWAKVKDVENGIATITGVSANTGSIVPSALMHTRWSNLKGFVAADTKVAREKLGSGSVFRLSTKRQFSFTLWIDAKSYFIVKTQLEMRGQKIEVNYQPPVVDKAIPASRFKRG